MTQYGSLDKYPFSKRRAGFTPPSPGFMRRRNGGMNPALRDGLQPFAAERLT
jgi:hypothetical protein